MLERDGSEGLTPQAATREAPAAWPGLEMASTGVTSMGRSQHPSFALQTAQPWLAVGQGEAVGLAGAVSHSPSALAVPTVSLAGTALPPPSTSPEPWEDRDCPWVAAMCAGCTRGASPGTGDAAGGRFTVAALGP